MPSTDTMRKTLLASATIILLTTIHHAYGAVVYSTPWRYHVAAVALPVLLVLILAYRIHRRVSPTWLGRTALWFFVVLTILFPIAGIGLFEGGYNHFVKDVLYFARVPRTLFNQLFPSPPYERPEDAFFEVTGILQFLVGLYNGSCLLTWWRQSRGEEMDGSLTMREAAPHV